MTPRSRVGILVSVLAFSGIACAQRATRTGPAPIEGTACAPLRPGGVHAGALFAADSFLVAGQTEEALVRYRALSEALPRCAVPRARTGDAERLLGQRERARTAYEEALALDPCLGAAAGGRAALSLPIRTGTEVRLDAIETELETARRCGGDDPELLGKLWRARVLAGDARGARHALWALERALDPVARAYGTNLVREVPRDGLLVTGSDLETDVAMVAAERRDGPLVIDLGLLEHPAYVRFLVRSGLPIDLDEHEIENLVPARFGGRLRPVSEQVLHRSIEAAILAQRDVHFSDRVTDPLGYAFQDDLTLVGLTFDLDAREGGMGAVDFPRVREALESADLTAFAAYDPARIGAGSAFRAVETHRLVEGYVRVALKGAVAAFRRDDTPSGRALVDRARALGESVGVAGELRERLREVAEFAGPPALP